MKPHDFYMAALKAAAPRGMLDLGARLSHYNDVEYFIGPYRGTMRAKGDWRPGVLKIKITLMMDREISLMMVKERAQWVVEPTESEIVQLRLYL